MDSSRLSYGHSSSREAADKGDIVASYSADSIALRGTVRKPFEWRNSRWVAVSIGPGSACASAYRLLPTDLYDGRVWPSLNDKLANVDDARLDPKGLYHGVRVRRAGREWVLLGPPVRFVPGQARQLDLFGDG